MKTNFPFLLLTAMLMCTASASLQAQWRLGVSAGVNLADTDYSAPEGSGIAPENFDTGFTPYFAGGLTLLYRLNDRWAVGSGFQYSPKGYKVKDFNGSEGVKWRYHYLDVLPQVAFQPISGLELILGANIGNSVREEFKAPDHEWTDATDVKIIQNLDVGLLAGVRGEYRQFFLQFSYLHGLTDNTDIRFTDGNGDPIGEGKQFNRTLQLMLGYWLDFGK